MSGNIICISICVHLEYIYIDYYCYYYYYYILYIIYGGFHKWRYPKMDGL